MLFKINQRETKRRVLDFFQTDFYYLEAMAGIKARDILPSTKIAACCNYLPALKQR